jgi:hypothetical protein
MGLLYIYHYHSKRDVYEFGKISTYNEALTFAVAAAKQIFIPQYRV